MLRQLVQCQFPAKQQLKTIFQFDKLHHNIAGSEGKSPSRRKCFRPSATWAISRGKLVLSPKATAHFHQRYTKSYLQQKSAYTFLFVRKTYSYSNNSCIICHVFFLDLESRSSWKKKPCKCEMCKAKFTKKYRLWVVICFYTWRKKPYKIWW